MCGRHALFTEGAETEGVVAFREADAGGIEHERGVVETRRGHPEGAENEQLAKGAFCEVGTADDFSDGEIGVVDGTRELVAGDTVFAPDEEVTEVTAGDGRLRAEGGILKGENFAFGDAEAPVDVEVERRKRRVGGRAELGRVNRFIVGCGRGALVGRTEGVKDIAARAGAGKNRAGGMEAGEGGAVKRETLALIDDRLGPREAEPAEVFEHGGDEIEAEADGVEIVVAQEQGAAGGAGAFGGDPECARVAEMEVAGGRGREAAEVGSERFNHG